mgnify:CR=1 FL=1
MQKKKHSNKNSNSNNNYTKNRNNYNYNDALDPTSTSSSLSSRTISDFNPILPNYTSTPLEPDLHIFGSDSRQRNGSADTAKEMRGNFQESLARWSRVDDMPLHSKSKLSPLENQNNLQDYVNSNYRLAGYSEDIDSPTDFNKAQTKINPNLSKNSHQLCNQKSQSNLKVQNTKDSGTSSLHNQNVGNNSSREKSPLVAENENENSESLIDNNAINQNELQKMLFEVENEKLVKTSSQDSNRNNNNNDEEQDQEQDQNTENGQSTENNLPPSIIELYEDQLEWDNYIPSPCDEETNKIEDWANREIDEISEIIKQESVDHRRNVEEGSKIFDWPSNKLVEKMML